MRIKSPRVLALLLTGAVVLVGAGAPAWSQVGTVVSHQKLSDLAGNFTAVIDNADEFGGAVARLGDLDGKGPSVVALAVGTTGDDDGGPNRGAVYILFLDRTGNTLSYQKISNTAGGFTGVLENADDFGSSVAFLGDLDGAGPSVAALAVGTAGDDDGGLDRGAVYILFLKADGTVLSNQKISDTAGNFTAVIDSADELGGTCFGLGDLDGAGPSVAALAVGAIGDDDGGINRGCVYVLFLQSNGNVLSFQKISNTTGGFTATLDNADEFGSSVTGLGDLDGVGGSAGALAVGAIGDDDGGTDRGAVYVLFLNTTGIVAAHQKISDTAGNFTAPLLNLDELGGAVASLGKLDRNGAAVCALAVGAAGDDDGGPSHGAVYIMQLNSAGSVLSYQKISDTAGNFTGVLHDADEFGGALCAMGDINTGLDAAETTLVTGASFDDDGGPDRGAAWILFIEGTQPVDAGAPGAPRNMLGSASPNPFNPTTTIPFTMAETGWVEIHISNVQGRIVRELVLGRTGPGAHAVVWDGRDRAGNLVASGAYVYKLQVNQRSVAAPGKAVLLK